MVDWEELADWWLGEVVDDTAYSDDVMPLTMQVFEAPEGVVIDLGCGEGRVMRRLNRSRVIGCDLSRSLLVDAASAGAVVRGRLPSLGWLRPAAVVGAVAVMVVEHVADLVGFFAETSRVVAEDGMPTIVMNHPAYTAPQSGPIVDQSDGEVLWRWGPYFETTESHQPAGDKTVTFHHRPIATLLNEAASAGWILEQLEERPLSPATVARHPGLVGQEHFPRLLAVRWRRR